jgi:excisionase family DNA binding protein
MDRSLKSCKDLEYWPRTNELTKPAREVAKILNIHYNTLFRWIKGGKIEYVRFGDTSIHFTYDQIEHFINTNRESVKLRLEI